MLIVTILMVSFIALLAWAWVRGINNMKDDHPDYKGEDFLDWGDDEEDKDNNDNRSRSNK
jgi:hypothetical protein